MERIDAHHHLWRYRADEYPWMSDSLTVLRRDYLLDDLTAVTGAARIDRTIAVQARQCIEETEFLAEIACNSELVDAVVGWAPLIDGNVRSQLERLAHFPKVKGMRHVLHDEPDDFYILREDFNRGISWLKEFDLVFDLLIFERHLPQTIEFVDRHPQQRFVLDHIAKPRIRDKVISPWRENLLALAERENVYCKLSGMVTEADWTGWTKDDLCMYWDVVLEAFGARRIMFGSDWPVLTVASSYQNWLFTVEELVAGLSRDEQESIFARAAVDAYHLQPKDAAGTVS